MELYRLEDIMFMLSKEQARGYENINQLLHIMRHSKQHPERKRFTLIAALRYLSLYEIGYDGNMFIPNENTKERKFQPAPYDVFTCGIMDGYARFDVVMN